MKNLRTNAYLESSHIFMDVVSFVAGLILPLAFAPLNWFILAYLSPFLFLLALQDSSVKRALWRGWLYGFGCFAVGASWIFVSIHTFGNTSAFLAGVITFGFVAVLGLFFALMGYCWSKFFNNKSWLSLVIGFPCCWVLQEVFRSWFLTGFPWLLLGNSQINTWLAGFAPVISAYGVSFITVMLIALVFNAFQGSKRVLPSVILIAIILVGGLFLQKINWSKPLGKPMAASLVQGNISQTVKWNPMYLQSSLQRYANLSTQHFNSRLVVWPEGAVPDLLANQRAYFTRLDDAAKARHSAIITGVPMNDQKDHHFYNGVITLGDAYGLYMKRHLVPFGEYVPFENLLRGLIGFFNLPMSDFSAGPSNQALLKVGDVEIAPYLCYEIAYLPLVLREMPEAQVLLNMSDDSWFGESWAAAQQLQIAQMRSLEMAREQMIVANSGFTAFVNAKGRITAKLPRDKVGVLQGSIQPLQGSTPLVRIGWLIELCILLALSLVCVLFNFKSSKNK